MGADLVDTVVVRMDKIGDLVLSLPVDRHPVLRGARTHWFVTRGLGRLANRAVPPRRASEYGRAFSPFETMRMVRELRRARVRTIFLLHNPWWVALAAWLAGVPERVGRRSQWHAFLFVNLPVRQKRSRADRGEGDFNFDLVEWGSNRLGVRRTPDLERLKKIALALAPVDPAATLARVGLAAGEYRVVHPGMAGSALNWPPENYARLIEELAKDGPVVVTGTAADRRYLAGLERVQTLAGVRWLVEKLDFDQLLDVLFGARSVVAPSTGVVHLAAALGRPTLGLYSPRRVEHPRRWGPRGPRVAWLVPDERDVVPDDVMNEISVEAVRARVLDLEA